MLSTTTLCLIFLVVGLLSTRFDVPEPTQAAKNTHIIQAVALFALTCLWGFLTVKVAEMTSTKKPKPSDTSKIERAEKMYPQQCEDAGVSVHWFESMSECLRSSARCVSFLGVVTLGVVTLKVLPESVFEFVGNRINEAWDSALDTYSPKDMFIYGLMLAHLIPFYASTIFFAILDIWRPKALIPFKIQESVKITFKEYVHAILVATGNQVLLFFFIHLIWLILPDISPFAFAKELPSLLEIAVHLVICLPISEIVFYSTHRLLHTNWLWYHVHYFHHQQAAPFPPCCIYAHPVEFCMGNIPVVALGPMMMQSHAIIWFLWAFLATFSTAVSHSGWHLPFLLGESEGHDYHHSSGYMDNLGVIGTLDIIFKTNEHYNKSWQRRVDKTYGATAEYPVDKILFRNGATDSKGAAVSAVVVASA
eukprot:g5368.t1